MHAKTQSFDKYGLQGVVGGGAAGEYKYLCINIL